MRETEYLHRFTAALPVALAVMLAGILLLLAACGGDDASPTGDGSGSPTADGETPVPTGTVIGSPGSTASGPAECISRGDLGGLLTTLQFDSALGVYEPGEEIEMSFTLINCDDDAKRLHYSTTQRYVFIIEQVPDDFGPGAAKEVWRSSSGKTYEEIKGEQVIDSNATVVYTETWDQTETENDEPVSEGLYKVSAFSVGCARADQADCRFGPIQFVEITSGDN